MEEVLFLSCERVVVVHFVFALGRATHQFAEALIYRNVGAWCTCYIRF